MQGEEWVPVGLRRPFTGVRGGDAGPWGPEKGGLETKCACPAWLFPKSDRSFCEAWREVYFRL